jgi:hypothetical protein
MLWIAYAFRTGEIWSIDTTLFLFDQGSIAETAMEEGLVDGLQRYANVLKRLGLEPPYRWIAGIEGVEERHLEYAHRPGYMRVGRGPIDDWLAYTSYLLSEPPSVDKKFFGNLKKLRNWILSRVWPKTHPALKGALQNFGQVINDLVNKFEEYSEDDDDEDSEDAKLRTEKFYQKDIYERDVYDLLLRRFNYHVDLIEDLSFELTRAANYVCDQVRASLDRTFRINEGVLLVQRGPNMDLTWTTLRLEYRGKERIDKPYPGLRKFKDLRKKRDFNIGKGQDPEEDGKNQFGNQI